MASNDRRNILGQERIDERLVAEVIGIAHGIIADGKVSQAETEYLSKFLDARIHITGNPLVRTLKKRVDEILADGVVDDDEATDLLQTLIAFAGGDMEAGEMLKATTLPLCKPFPTMTFPSAAICFTGTFAFGQRRDCEAAVIVKGALPGSLTGSTRYLVIGTYATESWAQSSYGRKIEKAADMRAKGSPIRIVGETHWLEQMKLS